MIVLIPTSLSRLLKTMNLDELDIKSVEPVIFVDIGIGLQGLASFIFFVVAISLYHTANVGLVLLLTALAFIALPIFIYMTVHVWRSGLTVGITLGSGVVSTFISLMTAVFWAELSVCSKVPEGMIVPHYTCGNRVTYRLICLLSAAQFIIQVS